MDSQPVGFGTRLFLAFILPWRILFDAVLAGRIQQAAAGAPQRALEPEPAPKPELTQRDTTAALQLLGILQREGRFIDFLQEDVTAFSDAEIGAAARVVHGGCKRGLEQYVKLEAIRGEQEGDAVVLESGYDARRVQVTGNVVGEPPYRGRLAHHGWRVAEIQLPSVAQGHDATVVAMAEVELS